MFDRRDAQLGDRQNETDASNRAEACPYTLALI